MEPKTAEQRLQQMAEDHERRLRALEAQDRRDQPDRGNDTYGLLWVIDGGGSVISTGQYGHLQVPFACTIQSVTLLANQSGSIQVDIWKDTYANFPPTDADSITSSSPPAISSSNKDYDSTLSGWTKSISAGDVLAFNVDSCSSILRVTIMIQVEKT